MRVDKRRKNSAFESFVLKNSRSVGGNRNWRVETMLKKEKKLTKTDAQKLDIVSNAV
jgi:hypothetical protein